MKKTIICLMLVLAPFTGKAQDVFSSVLQQIEQNNTTLQAMRKQLEADVLQNKTELLPEDPEVEFGYLWGNPAGIGSRKDVSLSQSFDFPTAYVQRAKLSALQNNSLQHHFRSERMQLLLSAKELCIELVYCNKMQALYTQQLADAQKIANAYEQMMQKGEANRLDYNKAQLNHATIKDQLEHINIERESLMAQLATLNGGQPIAFNETVYQAPTLAADFEKWYAEAEACNPSLQYLRSQVEVAQRQIKLSQAEALPKMSVGYVGEFVGEERFQGIAVGMSIPLWHNKNKVKQARAAAIASKKAADDSRLQYYNHLKALHTQALGMQQSVIRYTTALKQNGNQALLMKAFEKKELSLLEYLLEMEYYYSCYQKQAEAEKELSQVWAELTAYTL